MKRFCLLGFAVTLSACTVGPNYGGPPAVASDAVARGTFARAADPAITAGPGLARWWESLSDPLLTRLIDDALAHSPTIDQAQARIREAQAQLRQRRAAQLPSVAATGSYLHAELPSVGLGTNSSAQAGANGSGDASTNLDFYNLDLNASWEIDLFGGLRRGAEQARRTVEARFADLADSQVSLSAQVAQAYVSLRDVQARIGLNNQSGQIQRRQLDLTRQRYDAGTASAIDVERLETALNNTQADAIPLASQRDEYLNQLAVLTGQAPGALDAALALALAGSVPLPPAQVQIGDPATLIANRPDVRVAERELAADTAAIGVNKARQLPSIRFMGILGLGGTSPGDALDTGNLTTLLAPQINWSFLDFGRARANTQQSEAQRDEAAAHYRQTVLEALQDAETSLSRFGNYRLQLGRRLLAETSASRAAALNDQRVTAGTSATIDQLDIERQRISASIAVVQAKAQLTNAYISVQKSLGLGWTAQKAR